MTAKLFHIAKFHSGIYIKPEREGDVYYVQAKNFDANGEFMPSISPEVKLDLKTERHLLKPGDVLLAVKGYNNFAIHYKGINPHAVASSTFIIIRLFDKTKILPDYLSWFLNQERMQQFFKNSAKGTDLPSITMKDLRDIEIPVPPLEKQRLILELDKLKKREKTLKQQIDKLRESRIQQQIFNALK